MTQSDWVLVVDDSELNRLVLAKTVESLGTPAQQAGSGEAALEMLRETLPALILMDCEMPGMDGYQTTREIRAQLSRDVPIYAVTAAPDADIESRCVAAGMNGVIAKPVDSAKLQALLNELARH